MYLKGQNGLTKDIEELATNAVPNSMITAGYWGQKSFTVSKTNCISLKARHPGI